jgi:hypothetical protein
MGESNYLADDNGKAIKGELFKSIQQYIGIEESDLEKIIEEGLQIPGKPSGMNIEMEEVIKIANIISSYVACTVFRELLNESVFPNYPDITFFTKMSSLNELPCLIVSTRGDEQVDVTHPLWRELNMETKEGRTLKFFYVYNPNKK